MTVETFVATSTSISISISTETKLVRSSIRVATSKNSKMEECSSLQWNSQEVLCVVIPSEVLWENVSVHRYYSTPGLKIAVGYRIITFQKS